MTTKSLSHLNVLVLDDNPTALIDIKARLFRISPQMAIHTEESLVKMHSLLEIASKTENFYDFLIMDLQFGEGTVQDGIDTIKVIKSSYSNLKIIAVSGKDTDVASIFEAGAFAFFRKPHYEGLSDTVRLWKSIDDLNMQLTSDSPNKNIFRSMIEHLNVGISVVDRRMKVLYLNNAQREMGEILTHEDGIGHLCYEIFAKGATDVCPECPVIYLFKNCESKSKTMTQMRGNGRYHRVTALPLRRNGEVIAAIKVAYDVTSREEFNTFRKGLEGELSLKRRIPMVLNAVASRGFKRVRMLLITDDGGFVESYRIRKQDNQLGNFRGHLESLFNDKPLVDVLTNRAPMVFECADPSRAPSWQRPEGDNNQYPIQYGLIPMVFADKVIGALYVDNYEFFDLDPDITRSPLPITIERLKDLSGLAEEGAKALFESKNMELARQGMKLLQMDIDMLHEPAIPELLQKLLENSIELVEEQQYRKIQKEDLCNISGVVARLEGNKLVRKACHAHPFKDIMGNWNIEKDNKVFTVRVFRTGTELYHNNLTDSSEWLAFLESLKHLPWATEDFIKYEGSLKSYVCFPLNVDKQTIGTLCLQSTTPYLFDETTLRILRAFVNRTTKAMARHHQVAEVRRIVEMYSAMALAKSLADENDVNRTIFTFLTGLTHKEGLAFNRAIYLEREGDHLKESCSIGPYDRDEGEPLYNRFESDGNVSSGVKM